MAVAGRSPVRSTIDQNVRLHGDGRSGVLAMAGALLAVTVAALSVLWFGRIS